MSVVVVRLTLVTRVLMIMIAELGLAMLMIVL